MASIRLDPRWRGMDGVFGGHVFGRVADTAVQTFEHRLAALTVCFVASVKPGDADIDLEVLHEGRRTATSRFTLQQDGRMRAHGLAEHTQPGSSHLWADRRELPQRPPISRFPPVGQVDLVFRDRLELIIVERSCEGAPGGAWVRLREAPVDVSLNSTEAVLATFLDVMPPALYAREVKPIFVPTLVFSAHFRTDVDADPAAWMFVSHTTVWASSDTCIDDATVWDARGYLLAQGRQTRAIRWAA